MSNESGGKGKSNERENESGIASRDKPTFMDNPHAPEVFSTGPVGVFFNEGNITVTFASHRVNHVTTPGPMNRVVIGRLVMPAAAWRDLTVELYDILQKRGEAPKPQSDKLQ